MERGRIILVWGMLGVITTGCSADKVNYEGFKVISVQITTENDVTFLQNLFSQENVDVWSFPQTTGSEVTFAVPGSRVADIMRSLGDAGLSASVMIDDVQRLIDEEAVFEQVERISSMRMGGGGGARINLNIYHDHSEINDYLDSVSANCSICRTLNIGRSYEGRTLKVIKLGHFTPGKRAIWIDAGIHAREWIAPATALFVIDKLVTGYLTGDEDATELLDAYVWYILPSANPDGYMYSRTQDRLWRKTRSPNQGNSCVGTDPNRNWDIGWMGIGTDSDPCGQTYGGTAPFSEVETRAISDFLLKMSNQLDMYLSFHSYGQYWLTAWGYIYDLPEDHADQIRVGQRAVDAILQTGRTHYTLGACANVLYPHSGGSLDWAKRAAGIRYSFTAELRDTGRYGFLLPEGGITPTGTEIWAALVEVTRAIQESG